MPLLIITQYKQLLTLFIVTGVIATIHACGIQLEPYMDLAPGQSYVSQAAGSLYTGDEWGLAASILTLLTNVTATSAIDYKAWQEVYIQCLRSTDPRL